MSTKQTPSLKQWLKIGSIAFGVSCGGTLPFTQHLGLSALIGLATMPGVLTGVMIRSHHPQIQRQLERGKLRLQELQQRNVILSQQLQLRHKDRQEIELRISQLHDLAANLTDRIDRDRDQHQQIAQKLATLDIYCQAQENLATNLDHKIQEKHACLLEVDTDLSNLKSELTQKYSLLHQLDTTISDRQKSQSETLAEVDRLNQIIAEKIPELAIQSQRLLDNESQLISTESELAVKQAELAELSIKQTLNDPVAQVYITERELDPLSDRLLQRELKIAQLELSSRQAELDNLEFKLHNKLQSINELDLDKSVQSLEPQPPIIARDIDIIAAASPWYERFTNNPHLTILKHIEKHGIITEAEASSKLGNARSVRQFANKLGEYTQDLPFSIRVESSPKGNRYLKEERN